MGGSVDENRLHHAFVAYIKNMDGELDINFFNKN
jgi:hypothetical protein